MYLSAPDAAALLREGRVVAIPTETVYGLAASLEQPSAVAEIFALKGRPANNPLIIHLASRDQINPFVDGLPEDFEALAQAFWPGPMTLVLDVKVDAIPEKVRAGLATAAFRVPQHPVAREVLQLSGPLVMPSANLSGRPSATMAKHVVEDFGADFPVVDGGACQRGLESTILIRQRGRWTIIRQGALSPEAFELVLGYLPAIQSANTKTPLCPGQLYRHYAPKAHLHLVKDMSDARGVLIGYDERHYPAGCRVLSLGSLKHPEQVAESLYKTLRQLDEESVSEAYVDMDIPSDGLWKTIFERLAKAAQS